MLSETQKKNFEFFTSQLSEYLQDPIKENKYAVFYDESLQGLYDSFESAYASACANFPLGEFIIQQIIDRSKIVEFLWAARA